MGFGSRLGLQDSQHVQICSGTVIRPSDIVPNAQGGLDAWGFEGMSPNYLGRRGWTKKTLKPGDEVTVNIDRKTDTVLSLIPNHPTAARTSAN